MRLPLALLAGLLLAGLAPLASADLVASCGSGAATTALACDNGPDQPCEGTWIGGTVSLTRCPQPDGSRRDRADLVVLEWSGNDRGAASVRAGQAGLLEARWEGDAYGCAITVQRVGQPNPFTQPCTAPPPSPSGASGTWGRLLP